jgi:hypothetical protein
MATISKGMPQLLEERANMTHVRPVISPRREALSPRGLGGYYRGNDPRPLGSVGQ